MYEVRMDNVHVGLNVGPTCSLCIGGPITDVNAGLYTFPRSTSKAQIPRDHQSTAYE